MAIGKASDFKIYNDQFFGGLVEATVQDTTALGSAGITVRARPIRGDFDYRSFIKLISSLVTRRDTTSVAAATDLAVPMDELISVKLNRKIGPVAQTLDAWRKAALPFGRADEGDDGARAFSRYLGTMTGKEVAVEMINTALSALTKALEAQAALLTTITTGTTINTVNLNTMLSKMGDAANRIVSFVMHSKTYFDLTAYQTTPANNGDITANGLIYGGVPGTFGRPVFVTDSPSLFVAGSPNRYRVLGLTNDAIVIENSETQEMGFDLITGLENLVHRMQGEYAYNLALKGFKWDVLNGGANPNAAAVTTATNWDKAVSQDKDLAGVVMVVD